MAKTTKTTEQMALRQTPGQKARMMEATDYLGISQAEFARKAVDLAAHLVKTIELFEKWTDEEPPIHGEWTGAPGDWKRHRETHLDPVMGLDVFAQDGDEDRFLRYFGAER